MTPRITADITSLHLTAKIPAGWRVNLDKTAEALSLRLNEEGLTLACRPYDLQCWLYVSVETMPGKGWGTNLNRGGVGIGCLVQSCVVLEKVE